MNRFKINQKANNHLFNMFWDKNITYCEAQLPGCQGSWMLSYAHRHKRRWYYDKPDEMLWDWGQVILACSACHRKIEKDKELTGKVFLKLRGEEDFLPEIRITKNTQKETIEQAKRFKF